MLELEVLVRPINIWMWIRVWMVFKEQLQESQRWQVEYVMFRFFKKKKKHYIEYKFLMNKMDESGNANEVIVINDIIAIGSDVCNKMITVFHMAVITNSSNWWFDWGTILHMCNYKAYFKTYG